MSDIFEKKLDREYRTPFEIGDEMREEYDFSNARKNPYADWLKKTNLNWQTLKKGVESNEY